MTQITLHEGDAVEILRSLEDESIDTVITSPPYWGLRDYGVDGQFGLEETIEEHIDTLVILFDEIKRVLKPKGTVYFNYGDCYATSKNGRSAKDTKKAGKDDRTFRDKPFDTSKRSNLKKGNLCLLPERIAMAFQDAGWIVRSRIIWGKKNGKPDSSGRFRPSYNHELIWLFSKNMPCYYNAAAVRQPTASSTKARLKQDVANQIGSDRQPGKTNGNFKAVGSVNDRLLRAYEPPVNEDGTEIWDMATASFREAHFATFPPELVQRCIDAGCPEGGVVLDPFVGSGTTPLIARAMGRSCIGIDLNSEYLDIARARLGLEPPAPMHQDIADLLGGEEDDPIMAMM